MVSKADLEDILDLPPLPILAPVPTMDAPGFSAVSQETREAYVGQVEMNAAQLRAMVLHLHKAVLRQDEIIASMRAENEILRGDHLVAIDRTLVDDIKRRAAL